MRNIAVDEQRALRHVANQVATSVRERSFEGNTGSDPDALRRADVERLDWAIAEVIRQLDRIGASDGEDAESSVISALAEDPGPGGRWTECEGRRDL
jgi:hypothetical protein